MRVAPSLFTSIVVVIKLMAPHVGEGKEHKNALNVDYCAHYAYRANAVTFEFNPTPSKCLLFTAINSLLNSNQNRYFMADMRKGSLETCSFENATLLSVVSDITRCDINKVICSELHKLNRYCLDSMNLCRECAALYTYNAVFNKCLKSITIHDQKVFSPSTVDPVEWCT
ncbi:hypothetical protein L596_019857 [Steinernema carpocapsae]|uniref:Apple domain-containing protein n=1 Tax=Steinernema carpocapsae TaxID=34508 RepID=A0A4U5MRW9_STECR|nr:hypothetical protein L596_019857 [Steinernema carpocapsae]